jgi:hypothetical protein
VLVLLSAEVAVAAVLSRLDVARSEKLMCVPSIATECTCRCATTVTREAVTATIAGPQQA